MPSPIGRTGEPAGNGNDNRISPGGADEGHDLVAVWPDHFDAAILAMREEVRPSLSQPKEDVCERELDAPVRPSFDELRPIRRMADSGKRDAPRRTIAIVVDDLGIAAETMGQIKTRLHKFLAEELQPNDLVAIIRTGGTVGALQQLNRLSPSRRRIQTGLSPYSRTASRSRRIPR